MSRCLEIGGPPCPVEGFEQLPEGILWGRDALPYPDGVFSLVYSSHTIEHVPWHLVRGALAEAVRVLVPGGILEIHTVDFAYLAGCYLKRRAGDLWRARGANPDLHPMRWLSSRVFSIGTAPGDPNWHLSLFDLTYLAELFRDVGLKGIEPVDEPRGREKHGRINLGLRGVRP